jgi:hypothetical protein
MFMARMLEQADSPQSNGALPVPQIWSAIAIAAIAEVRGGANDEQARGFFRALGQRIATALPVDDVEDLATLCEQVNLLWADLGWGVVSMAVGEDGIDLHHDGMPHAPSLADDGAWLWAAGPMLEGAYDHWFRALGSHAKLRTRVVSHTDGVFDLRHAA